MLPQWDTPAGHSASLEDGTEFLPEEAFRMNGVDARRVRGTVPRMHGGHCDGGLRNIQPQSQKIRDSWPPRL